MCRYCKDLTDDKDVVHAFATRAAERASESVGRTIDADELELDLGTMTWKQSDGIVSRAAQGARLAHPRTVFGLFR